MPKKRLTVERVFGDPNLTGRTPIRLELAPDGKRVTYLRPKEENDDILDLWTYDIETAQHAPLVRTEELVSPDQIEVSEQEAARRERMRIRQQGIVDYQWAKSRDRLLFPLSGAVYVMDLCAGAKCRVQRVIGPEQGAPFDPQFSPQGTAMAFVREGNLFVVPVPSGEVRQLTADGSGTVRNGVAEFIAQEEMGRQTGHWWSPDGRFIAYTQVDEAKVPLVKRPEYHAERVEIVEQRYPAAGEVNAVVRVKVVDVETGRTVLMDAGDADDVYIARVDWLPDSRAVAIQVQSRDQKTLDLLFADPVTGVARLVLRETDPCWVELHSDLWFLEESRQFIWASERDGFKHLYLYDWGGNLIRQLSRGPWPVGKLRGVDEERGLAYWEGWTESPLEQHLYRVALAEGVRTAQPERVSWEAGWHETTVARDCAHWIDVFSDVRCPARVYLRSIEGKCLATLEANQLPERDEYAWAESDFVTIAAADGTPLHARVTRPLDMEPGRRYPAIVKVYGGPHAQTVDRSWDNTLTTELFAHQGFVVLELDNRGMGNRGKAFGTALYLHMGGVEVKDQVAGVEYLKASCPYVDPARIGVFGWSYGGYMALMCMTRAPDVFRAGVAVAPVTDWRLYDTHYTERYMGQPQANADGYRESSVLTHAQGLRGKLLLVHGMADDNVLFQHSVLLMDALQKASIAFEMMAYPGKKHGINGKAARIHLYEMVLAHFRRHLG